LTERFDDVMGNQRKSLKDLFEKLDKKERKTPSYKFAKLMRSYENFGVKVLR